MNTRVLIVVLGFLGLPSLGLADAAQAGSATSTRTIYLVRHGAYDLSPQSGDESTVYGLTPLGIAEARLIAARLRGMPASFDTLTSSTYTRARQTADVINESLPQLKHETDPLLCECLPPTRVPQNRPDATPENFAAAEKQLDAVFARYFVPATDHDRHDIIVAHGNVIRWLVMKALAVDPKAWTGFNVAHCSLTIIQVRGDGSCKVLEVGDTGHIPPNMLSGQTKNDPQLAVP